MAQQEEDNFISDRREISDNRVDIIEDQPSPDESKGAGSYMVIVLAGLIVIPILFISIYEVNKHMHHHLLVWKYHDHVRKKRRRKKLVFSKDGKIDGFDVTELRSYIRKCLGWHYPNQRIKKACMHIGWEEEVVKEVIREEKKIK